MSLHAAVVGPSVLLGLHERVKQVIARTRHQDANACEVMVLLEQGLSTSVRQGEVGTVELNRNQGFDITFYVGRRKGSVSTSATGEVAVCETMVAALAIARHTSEDECVGLANAVLMARELPELDLYHPWSLSPEQVVERILACEVAASTADRRITKADGTTLNAHQGCRVYGNSHDFIGGYVSTRHSLSCVMTAEGEGQMQRDYWYDVSHRDEALVSAESIGRCTTERAVSRLGARPVQTIEAPVLLAPEIAVGLFGHFLGAISGGSLYRKSSLLEGVLDQYLFPEWLSIDEQPHLVGMSGSASFGSSGLAIYARPFVENGELVLYILDTCSGRKLGLPSTANAGGMHNLFVNHGDKDQAALIRRMGRGPLATELMEQGVSLVTGGYSRGVADYWIEDGEIQFPVQEVAIAANLRDLFHRVVAAGRDTERRSNLRTSSVLVGSMTVAGC